MVVGRFGVAFATTLFVACAVESRAADAALPPLLLPVARTATTALSTSSLRANAAIDSTTSTPLSTTPAALTTMAALQAQTTTGTHSHRVLPPDYPMFWRVLALVIIGMVLYTMYRCCRATLCKAKAPTYHCSVCHRVEEQLWPHDADSHHCQICNGGTKWVEGPKRGLPLADRPDLQDAQQAGVGGEESSQPPCSSWADAPIILGEAAQGSPRALGYTSLGERDAQPVAGVSAASGSAFTTGGVPHSDPDMRKAAAVLVASEVAAGIGAAVAAAGDVQEVAGKS